MDWMWILIGLAAVCVFTCIVAGVTSVIRSNRTDGIKERRPGYQEVMVKEGVDIKSMQYIHETPRFPNQEGIESFPTMLTEDGLQNHEITLIEKGSGKRYNCRFTGRLIMGRDPAAGIDETGFIVNDAAVSKTHCRIESKGNTMELADLRSRNGTYINGRLLSGTGLLHSGDSITIGNTTYTAEFRER